MNKTLTFFLFAYIIEDIDTEIYTGTSIIQAKSARNSINFRCFAGNRPVDLAGIFVLCPLDCHNVTRGIHFKCESVDYFYKAPQ
jgi:hypothetical protein